MSRPAKPRPTPSVDANQWAAQAVAAATGLEPPKGLLKAVLKRQGIVSPKVYTKIGFGFREKNPAAVALGRLGGAKGGKARAKSLSAEKRSEIARKAARARWQRAEVAWAKAVKLLKAGLTPEAVEKRLNLRPGSLNRSLSAPTRAKLRAVLERSRGPQVHAPV